MAKIVVRLPEPKQEYDISNQKQINRALTTVVEQLNSTFLETEKEEQQRFNFFLSKWQMFIKIYRQQLVQLGLM